MLVMVMILLIPSCERAAAVIPWYSAGYWIDPVAMIALCPDIRRGVDATVPIMPGFVSDIVVPWKSSRVSLPVLAFLMTSLKL